MSMYVGILERTGVAVMESLRDNFAGQAMRMLMATADRPHPLSGELQTLLRILILNLPDTPLGHDLKYEALRMVDRLSLGATRGDIARWAYEMADVMLTARLVGYQAASPVPTVEEQTSSAASSDPQTAE